MFPPLLRTFKKHTSVTVLALFLGCRFWRCGVCGERRKLKVKCAMKKLQQLLNTLWRRVLKTLANYSLLSLNWVTPSQRQDSSTVQDLYPSKWPKSGRGGGQFSTCSTLLELEALFHVRIAASGKPLNELQPALMQTLADGAEWKAVPWHQHRSPSETFKKKKWKKEKKTQPDQRQGLVGQYNRGKNYRGLLQLARYGLPLRYYAVRRVK